jgi:spore germination cell wall hydrolase CwlJ-like protein
MSLACDRKAERAQSWIGLAPGRPAARPKSWRKAGLACDRKPKAAAKKPDHGAHTLGAACVLLAAMTLNFALYPDAIASAVGLQMARPVLAPHAEYMEAAINPADVHLLAATAWAEARGEGEPGMRAVAHVIVNRLGPRFGEDLHTVIFAPKQFSAWNLGDPNRPLALDPERYATRGEALQSWEVAQQVALQVLEGQSADPTNGALFYHAQSVRPVWSHYGVGRMVIGGHVFYHNVNAAPAQVVDAQAAQITTVSSAPANLSASNETAAQ